MKRIWDSLIPKIAFTFYIALVILYWSLSGCGMSTGSGPTDSRALEIWKRHEAVADRAIKGYQNEDEFIDACLFFKRITGISIDVNMYTFGFIPQAEAPGDLERIRAWYRKNHSRLYWDEESKAVQVREQ